MRRILPLPLVAPTGAGYRETCTRLVQCLLLTDPPPGRIVLVRKYLTVPDPPGNGVVHGCQRELWQIDTFRTKRLIAGANRPSGSDTVHPEAPVRSGSSPTRTKVALQRHRAETFLRVARELAGVAVVSMGSHFSAIWNRSSSSAVSPLSGCRKLSHQSPVLPYCSNSRSRLNAALIRPRCVSAWGKLPRSSPRQLTSSENRPR